MRRVAMGVLGVFLMAGALPVVAQDDGARPAPKLIQIYREMVKPGRGAHTQSSRRGGPRLTRQARIPHITWR